MDPLAEQFEEWNPYAYTFNNPINFTDPTGMAPEDIRIKGANNSSVTIVTDLLDVTVDASSIVGDLGGNYTFQGTDILIAALDIVGIFDPSGVADVAAASLEAEQGNYFSAAGSLLGVVPLAGDVIGKSGKIGKHVKTINNAIDGAKTVNANSKANEKAQTIYGLAKKGTDKIEKVGISSGKLDKSGVPYRANKQVNKLGKDKYEAKVLDNQPAGMNARAKGLELEKKHTNANKSTINPNIHKRPKPE